MRGVKTLAKKIAKDSYKEAVRAIKEHTGDIFVGPVGTEDMIDVKVTKKSAEDFAAEVRDTGYVIDVGKYNGTMVLYMAEHAEYLAENELKSKQRKAARSSNG